MRYERGWYHHVQLGESLPVLSSRYGVELAYLAKVNKISESAKMAVGSMIYIPPHSGYYYQVKKTEPLEAAAKRFRLDADYLAASNGLARGTTLRPGDVLMIPTRARPPGASSSPAKPIERSSPAESPAAAGKSSGTFTAKASDSRAKSSDAPAKSRLAESSLPRANGSSGLESALAPESGPESGAEDESAAKTGASPKFESAKRPEKSSPAGAPSRASALGASSSPPSSSSPSPSSSSSPLSPNLSLSPISSSAASSLSSAAPYQAPSAASSAPASASAKSPVAKAGAKAAAAKANASAKPPARRPPGASSRPDFRWPVEGTLTRGYFNNSEGKHLGLDIAAPEGTPIRASSGGTVLYSGDEIPGYGRMVIVDHGNGWASCYAHNSANLVRGNERVQAGDLIARVGETGRASGPHCHFEIRRNQEALDPMPFLP